MGYISSGRTFLGDFGRQLDMIIGDNIKRTSNTRPKMFVSHAYIVNVSIFTSFLRRNLETALSI